MVSPAIARSSTVTTSSSTRRPLGNPAGSPATKPNGLGLDEGGTATFSRRRSACVAPV